MPSRKAAALSATRQVRWVEGFKSSKENPQPVFWGQIKTAKVGEREVSAPTDRNSHFVFPADPKVKKSKPRPKYSDAVKKLLQIAADKVIALIQKVADGEVTSFTYSAEANTLRYAQKVDVAGTQVVENKETDDETLLEAAQDFADTVTNNVASDGKPLTVAEAPSVGPALKDEE